MLAKALRSLPVASKARADKLRSDKSWKMDRLAEQQLDFLKFLRYEVVMLAEEELPGALVIGTVKKLYSPRALPYRAFSFRLRLAMSYRDDDWHFRIRKLESYEQMSYQAYLYDLIGYKPSKDESRVWYGLHVPLTTERGLKEIKELTSEIRHKRLELQKRSVCASKSLK